MANSEAEVTPIVSVQGGIWSKNFMGQWSFFPDPVIAGHGVLVPPNVSYQQMVAVIKDSNGIHTLTPLLLTYPHPEWNVTPDGRYITPIEVSTDAHLFLYMDVRRTKPGLPLCFTTGADAIEAFYYLTRSILQNPGGGFSRLPPPPPSNIGQQPGSGGVGHGRVAATELLIHELFTEDERRLINRIHMEREVNQSLHLMPSQGTVGGLVPRDYRSNDVVIIIDAEDEELEQALTSNPQRQNQGGNNYQVAHVPDIGDSTMDIEGNESAVVVPHVPVPPGNPNPQAANVLVPPGNPNPQAARLEERSLWMEFNDARASLLGAPQLATISEIGGIVAAPEEAPHTVEGQSVVSVTYDHGFLHENSSTGSSDDLLLLLDAEIESCRADIFAEEMTNAMTQPPANPCVGEDDGPAEAEISGGDGAKRSTKTPNLSLSLGAGGQCPGPSTVKPNLVLSLSGSNSTNYPANCSQPQNEKAATQNEKAATPGFSMTQLASAIHDPNNKETLTAGPSGGRAAARSEVPIVSLNDDSDFESDPLGEYVNNVNEVRPGMRFRNRAAFKTHMGMYALAHKFQYRSLQSKPAQTVLICKGASCSWRVYAVRLIDSDVYEIRKVNPTHHCTVDDRRNYQRQATTTVIGDMIRGRYVGPSMGPRPNEIRELLRGAHDVRISYWKAWHAREVAIDAAKGSAQNSYNMLPTYLTKLVHANPGSVVEIRTEKMKEGGDRFKYMFIAFGASIAGFPFLRKVVAVDGTHLTGKYAGCLLSAVAQDGNYGIFPLAFAVVDDENDKSWEWFFQNLAKFVKDGNNLVFISDRHASIYAGLSKVFPLASHCACVQHLKRNIKTYFKSRELGYLVQRAAYAYLVGDFRRIFAEISRIDKACADYLEDIGFSHWTRAHFPGKRYNIMTSNLVESWNGAIREAREYPISSLIEHIRSKLMTWFAERREIGKNVSSNLTPRIEGILANNFEASAGFDVKNINQTEFEVRDKNGIPYHVDLDAKACTCFEFQHLSIPCTHAIAAAIKGDILVESLLGDEFRVQNMEAAYAGNINPVVEFDNIDGVMEALAKMCISPPATKRPPGRPRKKRFLSRGEHRLRGVRRAVVCSRCKGGGHNRATCKMAI